MVEQDRAVQAQVERILHSETLRNSDALRRLLKFLADRSLAGEADALKEYSIGIDALGKPPTYDPKQDSIVRIQVSRLRHKLADYYQSEGRDDPLLIELPKGHFKLSFESRSPPAEVTMPAPVTGGRGAAADWRRAAAATGVALLIAVAWGASATVKLRREQEISAPIHAAWTPELQELWRPLLSTNRPLVISVGAPLFVGLQGGGSYRDLSLNRWEDVAKSPKIGAIQRALKSPLILPRYYYTGVGTSTAMFQLGKLLAPTDARISIASSSQITWQQLADNNVLFIGASRVFSEQLAALPVDLAFVLDAKGVRNLHPQPGEPATLADAYLSITANPPPNALDDGMVYALITHTPGPLSSGDIVSFNSNHSPGTAAAVQCFTSPSLARTLTGKLRRPSGELPRYYQVVLRVKYKDAVPTEISYVMHRQLLPERRPTTK